MIMTFVVFPESSDDEGNCVPVGMVFFELVLVGLAVGRRVIVEVEPVGRGFAVVLVGSGGGVVGAGGSNEETGGSGSEEEAGGSGSKVGPGTFEEGSGGSGIAVEFCADTCSNAIQPKSNAVLKSRIRNCLEKLLLKPLFVVCKVATRQMAHDDPGPWQSLDSWAQCVY